MGIPQILIHGGRLVSIFQHTGRCLLVIQLVGSCRMLVSWIFAHWNFYLHLYSYLLSKWTCSQKSVETHAVIGCPSEPVSALGATIVAVKQAPRPSKRSLLSILIFVLCRESPRGFWVSQVSHKPPSQPECSLLIPFQEFYFSIFGCYCTRSHTHHADSLSQNALARVLELAPYENTWDKSAQIRQMTLSRRRAAISVGD